MFQFEDDGRYGYVSRYVPGDACIVISAIEFAESGVATAKDGQLTLVPSQAANIEVNCVGTRKSKPASTKTSMIPYRVIPGEKPQLELGYESGPTLFAKQ